MEEQLTQILLTAMMVYFIVSPILMAIVVFTSKLTVKNIKAVMIWSLIIAMIGAMFEAMQLGR